MATDVSWDWRLGLAGFLRISGAITLTGYFAIAFSGNRSLAQITPDATLGTETSIVTPNANVSGFPADLIEGGAARGANLFHSFSQFNVGDGLRVYFANPTGIENILSRVTGTDPSDILGTLGVDGEANLFLLNPNGIIFGQNAQLDIRGSFVASTANSLVFDNGLEFSATNPEPPPLLTINVPIGLQYGRQQPGSLVNAGNLTVGQQQNLTLVGGTIAITGQLSAPRGQITVAAVPSESLVQLGQAGEFLSVSPTSNPQSTTPDALSVAELLNSVEYDTGLRVTNDGQVEIIESGTQISADIGTTIISGSLDASDSSPEQIGGTAQVLGDKVGLFDSARIDVSGDAGGGTALIGGDFQGRGAVPNALRTFIGPNVIISADALTSGDGGQVIVWADEVTGFYGNISDRGGADSGNGGFVEVSGKNDLIFRGTVDASALYGNAGTLLLDPVDIIIADGGGDSAADGTDTFQGDNSGLAGSILSTPLSAINDTAPTTIFESELEGLAGETNIVLQATNDITINDLADNELNFAVGAGSITFTADADQDRVGSFAMQDTADVIVTNGRNIIISGASLTLGNIDTSFYFDTDVGDQLGTAQVLSTGLGVPLDTISGSFSDTDDVDLFQIYLTGGATFSASTVGLSTVDTQLFLFDSGGFGVYANDNAFNCGGCLQSTLPAGVPLTPTAPGIYYLAVTEFGVEPNNNGGNIFPELPYDGVNGAIGSGGALPIEGWTITSDYEEVGSYTITLTGAEAAVSTFTEPSVTSGAITLNATNGNIIAGNLNSSGIETGDGGMITLNSSGNIDTGNIYSGSGASFSNAGDAGAITLNASGNISTGDIYSSSYASGNAGDGGTITLNASGNITLGNVESSSSPSFGNAGDGGAISLNASGNITIGNLESSSFSHLGNAGNGSTITLHAIGNILAGQLDSFSFETETWGGEPSGSGGDIHLVSAVGSITTANLRSSGKDRRGNITLEANNDITLGVLIDDPFFGSPLSLGDTPLIDASGSGTGGDITLTSQAGTFALANGLLNSNASLQGNGGNIRIEAESVHLTNTELTTTSSGTGNAGNVIITAEDAVSLEISRIFSALELDAIGEGGDIQIEAGSVYLTEYSFIDSATFGQGEAGDVIVKADDSVSLINSGIFSITSGQGNAGSVSVQAGGAVSLIDSSISTAVNSGAVGNGGNVDIEAHSLSLTDGSQLQSLTRGTGDSGNIQLNVSDSITISGINSQGFLSGVFTSSDADNSGQGGDITVTTGDTLRVSDGAVFSTQTFSAADGGDITLYANRLELRDGGQFLTNTFSSGQAGDITVEATDSVILTGVDPNFANRVSPQLRDRPGVPTTLVEQEPNDLIAQAQAIDAFFSLSSPDNPNPDVEFSTRIPYVSISGTGSDPATVDYYSFEVTAGTRAIFDIDYGVASYDDSGYITPMNTVISLFDSQGELLASNDDASSSLGAEGSTALITSKFDTDLSDDAYLRYAFNASGSYFIEVNQIDPFDYDKDGISVPGTYALQVSLEVPGVVGNTIDSESASGMFARTEGAGSAGNVTINTPQLTVQDRAQVSASTSDIGQGGSLIVTAPEAVTVTNNAQLLVETSGTGRAGDVTISTGQLTIQEEAQVSASTSSTGQGGSLQINATDSVSLNNQGRLSSESRGTGAAGDMAINTPQLTLESGAEVSAATTSSEGGDITLQNLHTLQVRNSLISASTETGTAGGVTVNATELVQLEGRLADGRPGGLLAEATLGGNASSLRITTQQLTVSDGAQATVSSTGTGAAGDLEVQAGDVLLNNQAKLTAETEAGGGGNITLDGLNSLQVRNSLISASTETGTAGDVIVNATELVQLEGMFADGTPGGLLAEATLGGNASSLRITTQQLTVSDGAQATVSSTDTGAAGDLEVHAGDVLLNNQAKLTAETEAGGGGNITLDGLNSLQVRNSLISASTQTGTAGDVTVNASESVQLSGTGGLSVEATDGGTAGDLIVETGEMTVRDGAQVTVSSPRGQAGNLTISANSLVLNRGTLAAETGKSSAEGGANITLSSLDFLLMSNESLISANALEAANGGNINIDSQFIVALPPQGQKGSDIIANAVRGNGGRVSITTQGLFGIEFRPALTPLNDITASSEFGIAGSVTINQPTADPSRGLTQLPTGLVDATSLVDRSCTPGEGSLRNSSFTVTGRGGLPPSPDEPLNEEGLLEDLGTPVAVRDGEQERQRSANPPINSPPKQIIEAQGWVRTPDGQIILVAQAPTVTPQSPSFSSLSCQGVQAATD